MPIALHQIPGAFQVLALSVVACAVERVQGSGEVPPHSLLPYTGAFQFRNFLLPDVFQPRNQLHMCRDSF